MTSQIGFEFDPPKPNPTPSAPQTYKIEVAFRLLGMMAGEAMIFIEQIIERAGEADADEIRRLARTALAHLTDEPTRAFVNASAVRPRAVFMSKDCDYG